MSKQTAAKNTNFEDGELGNAIEQMKAKAATSLSIGDRKTAAEKFRGLATKLNTLDDMDVRDLNAAYDVLSHAADALGAFLNQPRFWNNDGETYSPAGKLVEDMQDAFRWVTQAIVKKMETMAPDDDSNELTGGFYLETILRHELMCGTTITDISARLSDIRLRIRENQRAKKMAAA